MIPLFRKDGCPTMCRLIIIVKLFLFFALHGFGFKGWGQTDTTLFRMPNEGGIDDDFDLVIGFSERFFLKDDTIYQYKVYPFHGKIDSLVKIDTYTKVSGRKWTNGTDSTGKPIITKFHRNNIDSKWFKSNQDKLSCFEHECSIAKPMHSVCIYPDGSKLIYWRLWKMAYVKYVGPK